MKKMIIGIMAIGIGAIITGCNRQIVDLTYNYTYGYVQLPNGKCVEGEISSWKDYYDGDQIQIVIDGVTYFTDTTRVVLTTDKGEKA